MSRPMPSLDEVHALPPLIDFGDENDGASPLAGSETRFGTSSSPFHDPLDPFEPSSVSPAGSSSSPFPAEQWRGLHGATESLDDHWDKTPQCPISFEVTSINKNSRGGSGSYANSNSYISRSPYQGKDLFSDISAVSMSHGQIDLLSSPDISSQQISDSKLPIYLSSFETHNLLDDALPLPPLDSMSLHMPKMHQKPLSQGTKSSYNPDGWLHEASPESSVSGSQPRSGSAQGSFSHMSPDVNNYDDFWSAPFCQQGIDETLSLRQSKSSQSGSTAISNTLDLYEGRNVVAPMVQDGHKSFHIIHEEQEAVSDTLELQSDLQQYTAAKGHNWPSQDHAVSKGQSAWPKHYNQRHQLERENCGHSFQDTEQKTSDPNHERLYESHRLSIGGMLEFVSSGGGKGVFKAPERGVERPVAFELRPQPHKELSMPSTRAFSWTDNSLWLGYEQGILVWDIPSAFKSNCDGKENLTGDEDAAAYSKLLHGPAPTCLCTDTANNIMWSGYKDGTVTAWPLFMESSSGSAIMTWEAHSTPVSALVMTSYGELWTGSDSGSLRAWPQNIIAQAVRSSQESIQVAASLVATSYIDLRARGISAGASSLASSDVHFLVAEHSQCRVWSGGPYLLALWDARTKDVLKVFGANIDTEYTSPNISPVREIGKREDLKMNATKVLKKEKSQGALSFFQRSRNAVIGAADAVLRAAVGTQLMDDSKKLEALVSAADGNVWAGYANGRLVQWDNVGNWVVEHRHSSSAVRCMHAFGSRIFVGYADGWVHTVAMDSGKLLGAWRAHSSPVARVGVCSSHLFSLGDNGALRGWFITSPSTFDKALQLKMAAKESAYLREESLKIFAGTWNVGQEKASFVSLMSWLEKGATEGNVIVVGLQEVEMGAGALAMAAAKETVGLAGSVNGQWWLDSIEDALNAVNGTKPFVCVGSRQLAGLLIGVWVTKQLLSYVGGVDVGAVACGFGRTFGNKGAVAVKMMMFRRTVCVVNCHFAAHMDAVAKRNADFDHIYSRMMFGRSAGGVGAMAASAVQIIRGNSNRQDMELQDYLSEKDNESGDVVTNMPELSEADLLIWVGDCNYRLADLSYMDALDLIYERNWEELLKKDQLRLEMKAGKVFPGMREAHIMFPPTYKYDKGCAGSGYDSSEKKRVPAWCDRVLFRDSFDRSGLQRKLGLSKPVAASACWYGDCRNATESDHKPVSCMLDIRVAVINEAARRWEYGHFLRTDPVAVSVQKEIEYVPDTIVHADNLAITDRAMATLRISNESSDKWAIFSFHSQGRPIVQLMQTNQRDEEREAGIGCSGLPMWLQVLPASGVLHPGEALDVGIQYAGRDVPFQDVSSSGWAMDTARARTVILVVMVKGLLSCSSKQHCIRVSHSFSRSFGEQHDDDLSCHSQRELNYRRGVL